jgi:hypothetical protein
MPVSSKGYEVGFGISQPQPFDQIPNWLLYPKLKTNFIALREQPMMITYRE